MRFPWYELAIIGVCFLWAAVTIGSLYYLYIHKTERVTIERPRLRITVEGENPPNISGVRDPKSRRPQCP